VWCSRASGDPTIISLPIEESVEEEEEEEEEEAVKEEARRQESVGS